MILKFKLATAALATCLSLAAQAQTNQPGGTNVFARPLSRADVIEIALRQNSAVLKGKQDLRASYGIEMQLRAVAYPQVTAAGGYNAEEKSLIENFPLPGNYSSYIHFPDQNWNADVKVQQSIYAGGRINSSLRSAKLTREEALLNYQADVGRHAPVRAHRV